MKPYGLAIALLFSLTSGFAQADWLILGEGTARWGLFKLYDAKVSAPKNISADTLLDDSTELKLELCYHRRLTVDNFVDGANHVLEKQALTPTLQQAVDKLHQAYQPVDKGDCYVLAYQPNQGTRLILNQKTLVTVDTPGFKATYFGIWLGEQPLSNTLKNALLENL